VRQEAPKRSRSNAGSDPAHAVRGGF
jgi:hypothetical protein